MLTLIAFQALMVTMRLTSAATCAGPNSAVVIEDDYDGEFRYDRQPVGALQTLAPDRVIYAGTASKSLAPGLRLGWLVVPPRLLDAVTDGLAASPSALDQLTLAEFITSGLYDRQVRRARLAYRRRRDRLARFVCTACGYACHADVNAARNIAAGLAVTARGGFRGAGPVNREPHLLTSFTGA